MSISNIQFSSLRVAILLGCLSLVGCAATSTHSPNPLEGAPGVVGSMAQAKGGLNVSDVRHPQPQEAERASPAHPQSNANSDASRAALKAAEAAYSRGDWQAAAQQFKQLAQIYPGNGQIWFGYGAAAALSGNLEEAAAGFEASLRLDASDVRSAYNLGLVRLSQADIALNSAGLSLEKAPAAVREEITKLRQDLAPLFGRSARMETNMNPRPAASRMQDPARELAGARSSSSISLGLPGSATP